MAFTPTRPPAGRLARLGIVLDAASPDSARMARFSARAGLGAVWLADERYGAGDGGFADRVWSAAVAIGPDLVATPLGLVLGPSVAADEVVDRVLGLGRKAGRGVEICLSGPDPHLAAEIRRRLSEAGVGNAKLSAIVDEGTNIARLLSGVDDLVLSAWRWPDLETAADEVRALAVEAGRDPTSLGVAAMLPVSIGRTEGEASARADRDATFEWIGHPREHGIFGTLEECQDRVIALAHAGITDLRTIPPAAPDVHDVIAQLTAITVGTTDVLIPGALRSPAPPPPDGWGGRPDRPPAPRVSGGSRRR